MTGEEMERAIEFLLQSQATLEQRIEQVNTNLSGQMQDLREQVQNIGERVTQLSDTVQMLSTSQGKFNEMITAAITALAEGQQHTDRKLDALLDIVRERLEGKDGTA